MSSNSIISICGDEPTGFIKANPTDSNFIFENDPSFQALNLYDFFEGLRQLIHILNVTITLSLDLNR